MNGGIWQATISKMKMKMKIEIENENENDEYDKSNAHHFRN